MEYGNKIEGLEFGLIVIPLMINVVDLVTTQTMVLYLLKMLLTDLRIYEMVAVMREFLYMTDYYNLSCK